MRAKPWCYAPTTWRKPRSSATASLCSSMGTPRDLARQLGRGQRLLLEPSATTFEQARRLLAVHPAVSSLNHTEVKGSLTFAVPDREDVPNLITLLVEKNVQLYRVELENTSLEDVYFALHHQQEVAG